MIIASGHEGLGYERYLAVRILETLNIKLPMEREDYPPTWLAS